jgi:hypothetical protein
MAEEVTGGVLMAGVLEMVPREWSIFLSLKGER